MAELTPLGKRSHEQPSPTEVQATGKNQTHLFTNESKKSASFEKWVPHEVVFGKHDFSFKVTQAWQQSSFAGVALLVILLVAKKFGWKPENVQKQERNVAVTQLHVLEKTESHVDPVAVQQLVQKGLGKVEEEFEAQVKTIKSHEIPTFLEKIGARKKELAAMPVSFGQTEIAERTQRLDKLSQEMTHRYLGSGTETLQEQFPKLRDRAVEIFTFQESLEKEIIKLTEAKKQTSAEHTVMRKEISEKEEVLLGLQQKVEAKMSERESVAKENVKAALPLLKQALQEKSTLESKIKNLKDEVEKSSQSRSRKETLLQKMQEEQIELPRRLKSLKKAREEKLNNLTKDLKDSWEIKKKELETSLIELEDKDTRMEKLDYTDKGNEKVTGFFGERAVKLSSKEKKELGELQTDAVNRKRKQEEIKKEIEEGKIELKRKITEIETKQVARIFDAEITQTENKLNSLPDLIEKNKTEMTEGLQSENANEKIIEKMQMSLLETETKISFETKKVQDALKTFSDMKHETQALEEYRAMSEKPVLSAFLREQSQRTENFMQEENFLKDLDTLGISREFYNQYLK